MDGKWAVGVSTRQTHEMYAKIIASNKHSGACHGKTPWRGTAFYHDTPHPAPGRAYFKYIFPSYVFRLDIE
jgi:hypothetical protein